jgi:hypothetical protein
LTLNGTEGVLLILSLSSFVRVRVYAG